MAYLLRHVVELSIRTKIDGFHTMRSIPSHPFDRNKLIWFILYEVYYIKNVLICFCLEIKSVDNKKSINGSKHHHCFDNDVINYTITVPFWSRSGHVLSHYLPNNINLCEILPSCDHCDHCCIWVKQGLSKCPCDMVAYCGKECQVADWKVHKKECTYHSNK
jgi:hypothetical protein